MGAACEKEGERMPAVSTRQPVTRDFCKCLACQKAAGHPGSAGGRSMSFRGTNGYYGTRAWNPQGLGPSYYGMELELAHAGHDVWRAAFSRLGGKALAEVKPDGSL